MKPKPNIKPKPVKSEHLQFKASSEQRALIIARAKQCKLTLSEYILSCCMGVSAFQFVHVDEVQKFVSDLMYRSMILFSENSHMREIIKREIKNFSDDDVVDVKTEYTIRREKVAEGEPMDLIISASNREMRITVPLQLEPIMQAFLDVFSRQDDVEIMRSLSKAEIDAQLEQFITQ